MTTKITDAKLLFLCNLYGDRARFFRQKFIGLLPEVYKRKLYLKTGCTSIFEFAAKLAGVSEEQVTRVLNLERKFQDKPDLHDALVTGEVSVNKLARVSGIATVENQKVLAEQSKILSQKALGTLTRDEKMACSVRAHGLGNQTSISQGPSLRLQMKAAVEVDPLLSPQVKAKLFELQQKGIDINELILDAIKKREEEIANIKQKLANEQRKQQQGQDVSRHIPTKVKQILQQEYGTKCAMPNCPKEAEHIHHELPFAMLGNHDPYFLKPLCEEHHEIAHGIQLAYQSNRRVALNSST